MKKRKPIRVLSIVATLIGIFLISGMFWAGVLDPLIFNSAGEYRTDGAFRTLSPVLLQARMRLSFGWFYGIPLFLLGLIGTIALQPQSDSKDSIFQRHRLGFAALGVAAIAHILVLASSIQFFFVPAGSHIRPMGWALMMFIIGAGTFVVAVPIGAIAIRKERPRYLGAIGLVLGLTPFWFSSFLLHFAAWLKGLTRKWTRTQVSRAASLCGSLAPVTSTFSIAVSWSSSVMKSITTPAGCIISVCQIARSAGQFRWRKQQTN
jgi:hypothetical protein